MTTYLWALRNNNSVFAEEVVFSSTCHFIVFIVVWVFVEEHFLLQVLQFLQYCKFLVAYMRVHSGPLCHSQKTLKTLLQKWRCRFINLMYFISNIVCRIPFAYIAMMAKCCQHDYGGKIKVPIFDWIRSTTFSVNFYDCWQPIRNSFYSIAWQNLAITMAFTSKIVILCNELKENLISVFS